MKRVIYSALSLSLLFLLAGCGGGNVDESLLPTRVATLDVEQFVPPPPTATTVPTVIPAPSSTPVPVEPTATTQAIAPSAGITPTAIAVVTAIATTEEITAAQTTTPTQAITGTFEITPDITSDITSDITPTVTSPITSPISGSPEFTATGATTESTEITATPEATSASDITSASEVSNRDEISETTQVTTTATETVTESEDTNEGLSTGNVATQTPSSSATVSPSATTPVTPAATETPTATSEAAGNAAPPEVDPALVGLPAEILAAMASADPAHGKQLSLTNACIGCHNLDPNVKLVGPTWYDIATTAGERVPGMSSGLYLYNSIVHPNDYVVEGYPAGVMLQIFGNLPAQDLADLISFLLTQKEHS